MDNDNKNKKSGAEKPHYYGDVGGVHIFHATHEDHAGLVGRHIENPTDETLKIATEEAKKLGTPVVVIHGTPPASLRHKIELKKSESFKKNDIVNAEPLAKAFLQPDQQTRTDHVAHMAAIDTVPEWLMSWGKKNLVPLKKDQIASPTLGQHTIKVRKLDPDLYQGWVEDSGANKVHNFEKVTMPELLSQLQSKLEAYGPDKETPKAEEPAPPMQEEAPEDVHDIGSMLEAHMKSRGHKFGDKWWEEPFEDDVIARAKAKLAGKKSAFDETQSDEDKEAEEFKRADQKKREEMTFAEINELEDQIKEVHGVQTGETVSLPRKDLMGGMLRPETDCEECGNPAEKCICYTGLPKPRLEFDGKKVTIFFKSEWGEEDRDAYIDDLKRRAGVILKKSLVLGK